MANRLLVLLCIHPDILAEPAATEDAEDASPDSAWWRPDVPASAGRDDDILLPPGDDADAADNADVAVAIMPSG